jgi:hypothetical protein
MGSWGIEIFEEDYALDWLADLCEHEEPKEFFQECLDIDGCDLELIECAGVLGTCAMIDGLLNGPRRSLPSEAKEWLTTHRSLAVKRLLKSAIQGLDAVLDDQSEACELWKESAEFYPKWRRSVLALRKRLSQSLTKRDVRHPNDGQRPRTTDSVKVIVKETPSKKSVPEFDRDTYFLPRKGSIADKKYVSWVYELSTPKGFAYIHQVAWDKKEGMLVRVIPGRYKKAVEDLSKLSLTQEVWYTYQDMETLARRKLVRRAGPMPIHSKWKERPAFLRGTIAEAGAKLVTYSVERPLGSDNWLRVNRYTATEQEKELSLSGYCTSPLFLYRIITEWTLKLSFERTLGKKLPSENRFDKIWPDFEKRYEVYIKSNWRNGSGN